MELTKNDPAVCPESIDAQAGSTSAVEIDLYDELISFAELSPEEQSRVADSPDKAPELPAVDSAAQSDERALSEPVLTQALVELDFAVQHAEAPADEVIDEDVALPEDRAELSVEPVEPDSATLDFAVQHAEAPAEKVSEEDTALPEDRAEVSVEPVDPDSATLDFAVQHAEAPADEVIDEVVALPEDRAEVSVEPVEPDSATLDSILQSTEQGAVPFGPVLTDAQIETVESEVLKPSADSGGLRISPVAWPRPSGPLSGFNLPPEVVYTGALSRGVCLACGAESGADDLFCLTCGVFIDEIASSLPSNPTCTECKQRIDADEIFCPWCGSSVTD